ncbi:unnamed protein product, partial [Polarella glacialis]
VSLHSRSNRKAVRQRLAAGALKQKHLAMILSGLPKHPAKNAKLEQYATDGDIAARWLCGIDSQEAFAEAEDGIADLGAGNGILGIGAMLLGAPRATFVEVDDLAADALEAGLREHDLLQRATILRSDITQVDTIAFACDVVLMNPPWGQRSHADRPFLEASIALARRAVHVMHSSFAVHLEPWASDGGWEAEKWMEAEFPLPRTYAHQKQDRAFTKAGMWRLRRKPTVQAAEDAT